MRFVFAIVAFVVAAVMIGAGIAQKTVFLPPSEVAASVTVHSPAAVTVIDGKTLNTFPRSQHLQVSGSPNVFAAYGRTEDVKAWIGDSTSYNRVHYDEDTKELASTLVEGDQTAVPNPEGSDLWLAEYSNPHALSQRVKVPTDISFVIVSNGTDPAPADIRLSWPLDDSTPWVGPLLIGGGAVLLIGLGLLLWAITHVRRARGPRRRSPKMPKLPKTPRYKPSKRPKSLPAGTRGRRSARGASMVVGPLALAGIVALSGCTQSSGSAVAPNADLAAPASSAKKAAAEPVQQPAVTELQATRIIDRIADVAAISDKKLDAKTLATRFAGPALALRTANYTIRKIDSTEPALAAIQTHVRLVLPQQNDLWPRTVFAVVDKADDSSVAPIALMLIQDDPRSQYKVHYAMNLEPGSVIPNVAAPSIGTQQLGPDNAFLTLAPVDIASAYGDILNRDTASTSYGLFSADGDTLRGAVGLSKKKQLQKKLPKTAKLTFSNAAGKEQPIVLATLDSGAIVATTLEETQTVKPVQAGAAVNAPKSIKALSGKAVSTKGITAVYGDQLLFSVPSNTQGGQIVLLGYAQGLISASEIKKK